MLTTIKRILVVFSVIGIVVLAAELIVLPFATEVLAQAGKTEPLDINSASVDQLKALPGIGDAYSKKIVEGRPYKRKDELVQRKVIPQPTYDKIKDQIVAKQK